ncbi:MAG: hypothetical protein D6718_07050 [Acidobacteria bacterium]|nr:MAG: hypothetical protein D6718_07050 [Acidobacteriota bacterium]
MRLLATCLLGIAVAAAGLSGWSYLAHAPEPPPGPEIATRSFSPEELAADLEFVLRTFEEVHPDLYFHVSKESIAARAAELRKALARPMTRKEFWPLLAELAASFGDGHTGLEFPGLELRSAIENGERWFPLEVDAFEDGALRVSAVHEPGAAVEPGAWLTSIAGRPAGELFSRFVKTLSGEKLYYREYQALRNFRILLWIEGLEPPFDIEWRTAPDAPAQRTVLGGVTWEALREAKEKRHSESADFRFERMDGDIGYLELRRMRRLGAFRSFLERTFREIQRRPIRGLVIDLRRNGGGSTDIGHALLSYITDKPYRMMARMELKVSRQKKRWIEETYFPRALRWLPLQYLHPLGRRIWRAPEGSILGFEAETKVPPENPLRYDGPVCVLIGPRTFSSAQKLANAIKDYHLATLIGRETGGNPNAFGEIYSFRLPHTRLQARASTKRYVRANGDASWSRGILPDIEVIPTLEDKRSGRDRALEVAREWILAQRSPEAAPARGRAGS